MTVYLFKVEEAAGKQSSFQFKQLRFTFHQDDECELHTEK